MKLAVVTAVSRLKNLPQVAESIRTGLSDSVAWHWFTVFDILKTAGTAAPLLDGRQTVLGISTPGAKSGFAQYRLAFETIQPGWWIHYVDDDSLLSEDFETIFLESISEYPEARAFEFRVQNWVPSGDDPPGFHDIGCGEGLVALREAYPPDAWTPVDQWSRDYALVDWFRKQPGFQKVERRAAHHNYLRRRHGQE